MVEALANTFIYLMGVAGAGKLTVAKAIAAKTGARVVDNHLINNPVFSVVRQDGVTPLPRAVWDRVFAIRVAVLETIATLSPPEWSFVFTHEAYGEAYDIAVYQMTREAAEVRKAQFLPVRLVCDPDEIARRVMNPERRILMKSANAAKSRARAAANATYDPGTRDVLTLNNTNLSPEAAADAIIRAARALGTAQAEAGAAR
jgi:cytidylate kinase